MTQVLITGGAGFIGCSLASELVQDATYEICVVDNLHPQVHQNDDWRRRLPAEVRFVPADVAHPDDLRALLRTMRPDVVVHLAAETGTGQSLREATRHARVNVMGTTALVDALSANGITPQRLVLTSSRAVYGEGLWVSSAGEPFYPGPRSCTQLEQRHWDPRARDGNPARPNPHRAAHVEPRPTNIYAATKLAQENVLAAWCSAFEVPLTVLRLQNVYGAGQAVENSYTGVLTYFARQALAGEQIEVFEGGGILRDFVHVKDVVHALTAAITLTGPSSQTLDIGYGMPMSLIDVATALASKANAPEPKVTDKFRLGDVRAAFADIQAATQTLGYHATMNLDAGLGDLLAFVEEHGIVKHD